MLSSSSGTFPLTSAQTAGLDDDSKVENHSNGPADTKNTSGLSQEALEQFLEIFDTKNFTREDVIQMASAMTQVIEDIHADEPPAHPLQPLQNLVLRIEERHGPHTKEFQALLEQVAKGLGDPGAARDRNNPKYFECYRKATLFDTAGVSAEELRELYRLAKKADTNSIGMRGLGAYFASFGLASIAGGILFKMIDPRPLLHRLFGWLLTVICISGGGAFAVDKLGPANEHARYTSARDTNSANAAMYRMLAFAPFILHVVPDLVTWYTDPGGKNSLTDAGALSFWRTVSGLLGAIGTHVIIRPILNKLGAREESLQTWLTTDNPTQLRSRLEELQNFQREGKQFPIAARRRPENRDDALQFDTKRHEAVVQTGKSLALATAGVFLPRFFAREVGLSPISGRVISDVFLVTWGFSTSLAGVVVSLTGSALSAAASGFSACFSACFSGPPGEEEDNVQEVIFHPISATTNHDQPIDRADRKNSIVEEDNNRAATVDTAAPEKS